MKTALDILPTSIQHKKDEQVPICTEQGNKLFSYLIKYA